MKENFNAYRFYEIKSPRKGRKLFCEAFWSANPLEDGRWHMNFFADYYPSTSVKVDNFSDLWPYIQNQYNDWVKFLNS